MMLFRSTGCLRRLRRRSCFSQMASRNGTYKEGSIVQESSRLQQRLWHSLLSVRQDSQHNARGALQRICRLVLHRRMLLQRAGKFGTRLPEARRHNFCILCSAPVQAHPGMQGDTTEVHKALPGILQVLLLPWRVACAPCLQWSCLGQSAGARQRPLPVQSNIIMYAR